MKPNIFYNMENLLQKDELKNNEYATIWRYLSVQLKSYFDILNSGITFSDNFKSTVVGSTFTAANTDTILKHGLGFVPTGYIPINYTAAMRIYTGDSAWSADNIVLKSDAVGSAQILVF